MPVNKYKLVSPVYLSGSISNDPEFKSRFARYKAHLEDLGYEVKNPAELEEPENPSTPPFLWRYMMRKALQMMLECNSVAVIPYNGTGDLSLSASKGVRIECVLASDLGMPLEILDAEI